MQESDSYRKNDVDEKLSSYWSARRKGEERDLLIQKYLTTYEVLTVELVMQLLDMPATASSRRIIEQRLQRIVQAKKAKKILESRTTYYVTPPVLQARKKPQLVHRLLESKWWVFLATAGFQIEDRRSSSLLWSQGGNLIPDSYCRIGTIGIFFEADTGTDDLGELRSKAERYQKHFDYFQTIYGFESYRVVFLTRSPVRVGHIAEKLKGVGSGWQWLITDEENIGTFLCVKDMQRHPLLED